MRGEIMQVLSIGLFDGIRALQVALDALKAPVAGHVSRRNPPRLREWLRPEANFPDR